jgi:hypothetical protein
LWRVTFEINKLDVDILCMYGILYLSVVLSIRIACVDFLIFDVCSL